ncbi:hypothetical protein ACSBR2_026742 [Camellia fascicularis]
MQFWLQIGGLYWFLFPSPCTLNRQITSQRAQGIQLCPKVNKIERELLKQEELDAQRLFLGNAKARKFPRSTLTSQVQSQTIRSSDVPRSVTVSIDNINGIAFNVVRSLWWADMVTTINNAPKGYKSPNYEKVRTSLLDKEPSKVQQSLNPLIQD